MNPRIAFFSLELFLLGIGLFLKFVQQNSAYSSIFFPVYNHHSPLSNLLIVNLIMCQEKRNNIKKRPGKAHIKKGLTIVNH